MPSMRSASFLFLLVSTALASPMPRARSEDVFIRVSAGEIDRRESIVSFPLPEGFEAPLRLVGPENAIDRINFPVQVDAQRRGWFVLPQLRHGASSVLQLRPKAPAPRGAEPLQTHPTTGGRVEFLRTGRPVFVYQGQPGAMPRSDIPAVYRRGGYVGAVFSPSGKLLTDDYPPNHIHHHGIWSPWTKTEFEGRNPDFWNMGDGKGRVDFVALDATWSGWVHAGFRSRHQFVDMLAKPEKVALDETWEMRLLNVGGNEKAPVNVFDLDITQRTAGQVPLKLLAYHYGGLGLRGARSWNGTNACSVLTSEGVTDRLASDGKPARWCWVGGDVQGVRTGIAVLGHPDNFRAPQPVRTHPSEPFFCFTPSKSGDWEIKPGQPYVARYRFVVSDGPPDAADIERRWKDFASPPKIEVSAP